MKLMLALSPLKMPWTKAVIDKAYMEYRLIKAVYSVQHLLRFLKLFHHCLALTNRVTL
jgi:hypothetical protein